jgi:hypothetical protein
MRNWGTIITAFYIVVVAALSPVFGLSVVWRLNLLDASFDPSRGADWVGVTAWAGWTLLIAGGPLVLLVSVHPRFERSRPRRHILVSAAAAGVALSLLVLAAVASISVAIMGDDVDWFWIVLLAIWIGSLLLWTLALWRMGERLFDPTTRVYRWLIKGSVLELLISVPSHVIVRARHDCCAPGVTGMGIATGLAILLMSIGPGALFLYRARMRRISAPRARGGGDVNRYQSAAGAEDQGR